MAGSDLGFCESVIGHCIVCGKNYRLYDLPWWYYDFSVGVAGQDGFLCKFNQADGLTRSLNER